MQFDIVPATTKFSLQVAQLTSELGYQVSTQETSAWLDELIHSPLNCVLLAVSGSRICGWIVAQKSLYLESGYKAEITGLVVGEKYRRNGIAESLVKGVEEWASEQGLKRVDVRSNAARKESHIFYPSVGFEHSKTSHVYTKFLDVMNKS